MCGPGVRGGFSIPQSKCTSSAAIYLRASTEEQRERQSIDTQREFGAKYADLHQLPIHRVYADNGVSGTIRLEKRSDGQRIPEAARRGEFSQLLIYKLARLGRDTRLILNAVAELEKYGVRVRSMTTEFDTATATGRLMLTMLSGFAGSFRMATEKRARAKKRASCSRKRKSPAWESRRPK